MSIAPMPTRGRLQTLEAVREVSGGSSFDPDVWHTIEQRDSALIADELMSGSGSNKFVYSFSMPGSGDVSGISVVGARHLASHYGGIKHRLVGSIHKIGSIFTFTSFPAPGIPMAVHVEVLRELEPEDDFYGAIIEVTDLKTGNTIMVEKRENRFEKKRNGDTYERPHYAIIAQSKAYRNGVLALIPQDTQLRWKQEMLKLVDANSKKEVITGSILEEKRTAVLRFAATKALSVDRHAIEALTMDQISGLSDAARTGVDAFRASADALRIVVEGGDGTKGTDTPPPSGRQQTQAPAATNRAGSAGAAARGSAPTTNTAAPSQQQQDPRPNPDEGSVTTGDAPVFGADLVDQYGELIGEGEITDPVAYAKAVAELMQREPPATIIDNNREGILAAVEASPAAADIIRAAQAPPSLVVAVPGNTRGQAWPLYVKNVKTAVVAVPREQLAEWGEANAANIKAAPDVQRLTIIKAIADYANAVGGTMPPAIAALVQAPAAGEVDRDEQWTVDSEQEIAKLADHNAVRLWLEGGIAAAKMPRLASDRPELWRRLNLALANRRGELDRQGDFPGDRP
jgi:hypothetical protein